MYGTVDIRHSPHGECGLKFRIEQSRSSLEKSLPPWGVWIEILQRQTTPTSPSVTPPISAFAEIFFVVCLTYVWRSSWKVVSGRLACLSNRFRLLYASGRQRLAHGIAFADAPRLFERIVHPLSIGGRDRHDQFVTKV